MTGGIAATCRAGRPFIVFLEDDYELMWHRGMNGLGGCFCDRHLVAFAERYGKRLPAAEIAEVKLRRAEVRLARLQDGTTALDLAESVLRSDVDNVVARARQRLLGAARIAHADGSARLEFDVSAAHFALYQNCRL